MFTTGGCNPGSQRTRPIFCLGLTGLSRCSSGGCLGTHQGSVGGEYLQDYLNEFTFRFNRRRSASRGKRFYRLTQQTVPDDEAKVRSNS